MKNRVITAILSLMLFFSLSACALSEQPAIRTEEHTAVATTEEVPARTEETIPTVVNTDETIPFPLSTPTPVVTAKLNVPDDIKAQDICIMSYFEALKENNVEKLIQTSASIEAGNIFSSYSNSTYCGDLFSIIQTTDVIEKTSQFVISLLSPFDITKQYNDYTEETIDEFITAVDPSKLSSITILMFGTPIEKPQTASSTSFSASTTNTDCRYCLFDFGGITYYQLFWVGQIGKSYKLAAIGLQDNMRSGIPVAASNEEFLKLVDPATIDVPSEEMMQSSKVFSGSTVYLHNLKQSLSPQFKSGADALAFFTDAVAQQNAYAVLSVFAIKERADSIDLYKLAEYIKSFIISERYLPSEYGFYHDLNIAGYACEYASRLLQFSLCLVEYDPASDSFESITDNFKNNIDKMSSLSVKRSDIIEVSQSEQGQLAGADVAHAYGAEDTEHRIIEYKFGNKTFVGGMQFLSYDGNWRIFHDSTAFVPIYLPVVPSSDLDYSQLK